MSWFQIVLASVECLIYNYKNCGYKKWSRLGRPVGHVSKDCKNICTTACILSFGGLYIDRVPYFS